MKVAVFFTFDYSLKTWMESGTLTREAQIYNKLQEDFDIKFVFYTYGNVTDLEYEEINNNFEVIPIYSKIKFSKSKLFRFIKSLIIPFLFSSQIKNVDIVHQHQLMGSWIPLLIKLIYKKPVVIRTGYNMEIFAKQDNKSIFIILFYKLLNYLSIKFCNLYTVSSKSDYKILQNKFKKNTISNLKIRPNWVEILNENRPIKHRHKNRILTVGRLEYQKNYKLLIEQFKNTSEDISIDVVGTGSMFDNLDKLAKTNNVSINFLGNIEFHKLLNLYSEYIFYFSTSYFEGNPKSLLEAMGSGCVAVASNIPNHNELIENNETGYLFDIENPNLLHIYNEALSNLDNLENISENSIDFIKENNNINNLSKNMYNDYKKILN